MKGVPKLFLVVGLLVCGLQKGCCFGSPLPQQFPLGTIGCLFTEQLCGSAEDCIDDLLFGNCQLSNSPHDYYQYRLSPKALEVLEYEIRRLIQKGVSWHNAYTQCILQNILLAYRQEQLFDESKCSDSLSYTTSDLNNEISSVLHNVLDSYENYEPEKVYFENAEPNYFLDDFSKSTKRDEIVQVHKYFDKSKGLHKRKLASPNLSQKLYNYLLFGQQENSRQRDIQQESDTDVSLEDIQTLQYYLQQLKSPRFSTDLAVNNDDLLTDTYPGPEPSDIQAPFPTRTSDQWTLDFQPGYLWTDESQAKQPVNEFSKDVSESNPMLDQSASEMEPLEGVVESSADEAIPELPSLPPPYANLLGKLLEGEIEAENLTDEQLEYITNYINSVLVQLGFSQNELTQLEQEYLARNNEKSENNSEFEEEIDGTNRNIVNEVSSSRSLDIQDDFKEPVIAEHEEEPLISEKKSVEEANPQKLSDVKNVVSPQAQTEEDLLYENYAFVQVAQNLQDNPRQVERLLETLEKILGVELPTFDQVIVSGNTVTFEVNPLAVGLNASYVAEQANEHKAELEAETGLTFENSGIGRENKVEVSHDDRYFVLTFILCGCIAGILLAVVVIYLIRRHNRSREKLAQLATAGEGNEASKDYQDLCRQHMQSKSSEKPEPLHAAARIGSVSENQVRSPSSRSSTSSWSEEPVSSNMDISTGHIVLSYMEDHLKNKDRLDREWEGLTSYEADPGSTNVASDQSNARKNRYGDVLPYDHSRVILSNTTNVTGSDYINASTITDHDPRNPAYIATQGPLPHTVADFWQMVWEQGSVVIVMLTKLTENGEAMCHRYWPEEGSDLYHIYEVHLVSEHIWCDDYLVRSFYLKNLQTNETRTVTQFHFLTWPDLGVPSSTKALLDFRRKVNKSYRGRSCPIVVHCSDGCGRTGSYSLIDMVLNRMTKGAKEIDIAATLEHIRDQRMTMVKTKEQFQFSLAAVADEVHAILKALPQ